MSDSLRPDVNREGAVLTGADEDGLQFAVVDVETTGLFPGGHDRICEIAIVRLRSDGAVVDQYCTLVNPERDLGPTHVHGISAADVCDAPVFADIAGDVTRLLDGAVFTAHNVPFDARFVSAEVQRLGLDVPEFPKLCTLQLASALGSGAPSRQLADLCVHYGIEFPQHHSAEHDALAAAGLLAYCLEQVGGVNGVPALRGMSVLPRWPQIPVTAAPVRRSDARVRQSCAPSFIERLVARLPVGDTESPQTTAYFALLDRVLDDRRVTEDECDALLELAEIAGLSRRDVVVTHEAYLGELAKVALADGVLSAPEQRDLEEVRRLLGLRPTALEAALQRASQGPTATDTPLGAEQLRGKTICFTGEMTCCVDGQRVTRAIAKQCAVDAGLVVKSGVSKKLDILVLADPDSLSGKAKKARALGVRLMAEPVLWRLLGVTVD